MGAELLIRILIALCQNATTFSSGVKLSRRSFCLVHARMNLWYDSMLTIDKLSLVEKIVSIMVISQAH